jgi:hypothetical protein
MVWCSLFGVFTHETIVAQCLKDKPNTLKWFTTIRKLETVKVRRNTSIDLKLIEISNDSIRLVDSGKEMGSENRK